MTSITLTAEQIQNIFSALVALEHRTNGLIDSEQYQTIVELCQMLEAPQFYTEYFERKALA